MLVHFVWTQHLVGVDHEPVCRDRRGVRCCPTPCNAVEATAKGFIPVVSFLCQKVAGVPPAPIARRNETIESIVNSGDGDA